MPSCLDVHLARSEIQTHVHADVGAVHASGNNLAMVDKDASDRSLVRSEGEFCLRSRLFSSDFI